MAFQCSEGQSFIKIYDMDGVNAFWKLQSVANFCQETFVILMRHKRHGDCKTVDLSIIDKDIYIFHFISTYESGFTRNAISFKFSYQILQFFIFISNYQYVLCQPALRISFLSTQTQEISSY